ncbi:MAG: DUF4837 family protein [Brumimicrobium sp.]
MKYILYIGVLCLILTACLDSTSPATEKQNQTNVTKRKLEKVERSVINAKSNSQYIGKPGQLIIVAEPTEYVDEIQALFDSVFSAPVRPYYPPTPYFEIYQRSPQDFRRLSTKLRNVIDIALDETLKEGEPTMRIYENYYSKTQLYTILRAQNMNDLYSLLENEIEYLFNLYNRQEWKREFLRNAENNHENTNAKLRSKFGIELTLPSKFRYESIDDTYAHIILPARSRQMELNIGSGNVTRTNYIQSGIMIWQYPYTDKSQLQPKNLEQMRDTILKKYAKHEIEGVYMGTQYHPAAMPVPKALKIGDIEGYEIRGLYKFTGEAEPSGGRYWEFHFKHPKRNMIVAISGYFDVPPTTSPHLDMNIIRAVIYSLKIADN